MCFRMLNICCGLFCKIINLMFLKKLFSGMVINWELYLFLMNKLMEFLIRLYNLYLKVLLIYEI